MAAPAISACSPKRRGARPIDRLEWYAIRTRSNYEFRVAAILADRFETFLPFYLRREYVHGVRTVRRRPLFPGYLFVRADRDRPRSVLVSTRGAIALLGGLRPEVIPAAVIENLRLAAADPAAIAPAEPIEGALVTIARGPLAGLTGVMERAKKGSQGGRRLIVRVEFLNRACALEINQAEVYSVARPAA